MLTPPMPSRRENWHGFDRTVFEFHGRTAWIVEPAGPELPGRPWTWCLEWAETYVERTGVAALLGGGFHHVHIDAKGFGNDEDMRVFREFHDFLAGQMGLAARPGMIGMSFGGLYALRYAAVNPGCVAAAYLDAPVCSFKDFKYLNYVVKPYGLTPGAALEDDPRLPVNQTALLADLPILLIYGQDDLAVNPRLNCELLIERLRAHGNAPIVHAREYWGHHPHGLDNPQPIVEFMKRHLA